MKVILLVIGKTAEQYLIEGMGIYEKRLKRYIDFKRVEIPGLKGIQSPEEQKRKESELILSHPDVTGSDFLIILDEKGIQYSSVEFSGFIQKQMNKGFKKIVFAVGGSYGFSEEVIKKADAKISFSRQTFSHQMIRLFFEEQLYRAMTILKREKYHH